MTILFGILGCFLCLAIFAGGFYTGWKLRCRLPDVTATALTEREQRHLQEEQQAFRTLQNYSAERAYGIHEGGMNI